MNRLFFDTETTGKANLKLPPEDPSQPRIVQLAAILDDDSRAPMAEINLLVRPDGWVIPAEATAVHGISTETATAFGLDADIVTWMFCALCDRADEIVAHNLDFDAFLIRAQLHRVGMSEYLPQLQAKQTRCTMRKATPLCKIPNKHGFSEYKWPNLQEAHTHFTGKGFDDAHDAMADVRACRAIYYAMLDLPSK